MNLRNCGSHVRSILRFNATEKSRRLFALKRAVH